MSTLSFPRYEMQKYPLLIYPRMFNLLRDTEFNKSKLIERVQRATYQMKDQHVLVSLLQQLTINPDWDLDYVVEYARLKSYSLASLFNITTISNPGKPVKDFFYGGECSESLCLIENKSSYVEDMLDINSLKPVVPLYTTITTHSYKPSIERAPTEPGVPSDYAIIGIDIVELAVSWWLYMKQDRTVDRGIHAFVVKYPMVNAQLIHNQLVVINVLYEHIVNEVPYSEFIGHDVVNFTLYDATHKLNEYYSWLVKTLRRGRLVNNGHLLAQIGRIYDHDYTNYVKAGKFGLFAQTRWIWEPAILKINAIYLKLGNDLFYRCGDINTGITLTNRVRTTTYNHQISDKHLRAHIIGLSDKVMQLNDENKN